MESEVTLLCKHGWGAAGSVQMSLEGKTECKEFSALHLPVPLLLWKVSSCLVCVCFEGGSGGGDVV